MTALKSKLCKMNTDTEKGSMMVRQLEISDIQNEYKLRGCIWWAFHFLYDFSICQIELIWGKIIMK